MGALTKEEISRLGFAAVGTDVAISDRCSIYGAHAITLGDHVRIDDFAIITAHERVTIGSYVHISAFAFLGGTFGIRIDDFVNVGPRATLMSGVDDFFGEWLPGPMMPDELRHVAGGTIHLEQHTIIGPHSLVLQGVTVGEGAAVGALSFVKRSLSPWGIYGGIPVRRIRDRPSQRVQSLAAGLRRPG